MCGANRYGADQWLNKRNTLRPHHVTSPTSSLVLSRLAGFL